MGSNLRNTDLLLHFPRLWHLSPWHFLLVTVGMLQKSAGDIPSHTWFLCFVWFIFVTFNVFIKSILYEQNLTIKVERRLIWLMWLAYSPIVKTSFPELAVSFHDFSPWISLGIFSMLHVTESVWVVLSRAWFLYFVWHLVPSHLGHARSTCWDNYFSQVCRNFPDFAPWTS